MSNVSRVNSFDGGIAGFLDEPASPPRSGPLMITSNLGDCPQIPSSILGGSLGRGSNSNKNSSASLRHRAAVSTTGDQVNCHKFIPEERELIERFMLRVKECGEIPAQILEWGAAGLEVETTGMVPLSRNPWGSTETPAFSGLEHNSSRILSSSVASSVSSTGHGIVFKSPARDSHDDQHASAPPTPYVALDSPKALQDAVEQGLIPVNPITGVPSARHLQVLAANRRYGFLPLDGDDSPHRPGICETECFDKTPRLLDSFVYMAESLFRLPRDQRREEMKRQLSLLECTLLPSNALYLPFQNSFHRVWRIVANECVVISTKERCPCILYLEIVDYIPKRRKTRGRGLLPALQRSYNGDEVSIDSRSSYDDRSQETAWLPPPTLSGDSNKLSDYEMVAKWREESRNPHRLSSLFDKVSTTVRDRVKAPLDKMKSHMKELYLRDRSISEELRNLTLSESMFTSSSDVKASLDVVESVTTVADDSDTDIEKTTTTAQIRTEENKAVPRVGSSASMMSMGQWAALPCPSPTNVSPSVIALSNDQVLTLPYGSDHCALESIMNRDPLASMGTVSVNSVSSITTKPPPVVFRESFQTKQERVRMSSAYGDHRYWRLLPILVKANDDLRQEQLASQLIHQMSVILAREKVSVWLCPYEIIALTDKGGIMEAIPDTISIDSLKRNTPHFTSLKDFFFSHFGSSSSPNELADARANFVESLAAYSMVCFLLQIKDRHNGNILLDNRGHLIHIDFGFYFLSSPGKNAGFESAPFKLTREFVEVLDGPESHLFRSYQELCVRTFLALRKHCMEIILLVEMLKSGNEEL
jgi:phosphatidylinositol 4-kinase B